MRYGVEFLPAAILGRPAFVRILALFTFPSFPSYTIQARTRISVCIRPCCINALGLREALSQFVLHNNALSLCESTSRLGLHNNALDLRETPSRLGLHKCPLPLGRTDASF